MFAFETFTTNEVTGIICCLEDYPWPLWPKTEGDEIVVYAIRPGKEEPSVAARLHIREPYKAFQTHYRGNSIFLNMYGFGETISVRIDYDGERFTWSTTHRPHPGAWLIQHDSASGDDLYVHAQNTDAGIVSTISSSCHPAPLHSFPTIANELAYTRLSETSFVYAAEAAVVFSNDGVLTTISTPCDVQKWSTVGDNKLLLVTDLSGDKLVVLDLETQKIVAVVETSHPGCGIWGLGGRLEEEGRKLRVYATFGNTVCEGILDLP